MKRPFLLGATALLLLPATAEAQTRIFGDCSPNGGIDVLDGLQVSRYSVGLDVPPGPGTEDFVACDVNSSGSLDVLDNLAISRYSVGLTVPEPVGLPILNNPPIANPGGPYSGLLSGTVTLDASGSSDDYPPLAELAWDLDGNGSYETVGTAATYICAAIGVVQIGLRAIDGFGVASTASASVTCLAPVDILAQWTDASGAPVTTVSVGTAVYLNICTIVSETQAFQADATVTGGLSRNGNGTDLNSTTAQGVCGDPAATDVVTQHTAQTGNPFNFQNFSLAPTAGSGMVGLTRVPFLASSAGAVDVSVSVDVWQLFSGTAPTSPTFSMAPLTVN